MWGDTITRKQNIIFYKVNESSKEILLSIIVS